MPMPPSPATTVPSAEPSAAAAKQVLVVDDLPEITEFFGALVRRIRGQQVHLTTEVDSARALELVRGRAFDLVVSDFRMRQVDGVEVLRAAFERNPDGGRVLMTGYNEIPTSIERIRQAHVDAYVQKPLRSQDLLLLMLDFLNGNASAIQAHRGQARELEALGEREEAFRGRA